MTVFLTPTMRPFHAGTYYPKEDRYGMPSFKRIMAAVLDAYENRRDQVEALAAEVTESLQRDSLSTTESSSAKTDLNAALLNSAYQGLVRGFDPIHGGLTRGNPKFPNPMNFEFVLRQYVHHRHEHALEVVTYSLRKMAHGGIYDQVGGGFHRYSVDERWLVPHFEKMLYDNAQLSRLYLHTWQVTGDPFFRAIAEQIYDYILREMTAPNGGFYSTTDADSEHEEGKFFVWTPDQIRAVLSVSEAEAVIAYFGVTNSGNFEGANILNIPVEDVEIAQKLGITPDELRVRIASARVKLYTEREKQIHPARDEKILTAWNGLMLASLAEAARVFGRDDYLQAAIRNAAFILSELSREGRLLRTAKDGTSKLNGYLKDYADLIDGLLELYQATHNPRYFEQARALADQVLIHFAVSPGGADGFYDTADDHEALIARPRSVQDNATPSGGSMMARVLITLAAYTGEARYEAAALDVLSPLATAMREYPQAFGEALNALDLLVHGIREVAIIGDPAQAATRALLSAVNTRFYPNLIRALSPVDVGAEAVPPLLASRTLINGVSAAYVCEHFVCKQPVTDPAALMALLKV